MERYYVKRPTGKVFGPFDKNAIRLMLEGDKIGEDAQVSTDKEVWRPIAEVEAFSDILGNRTRMGQPHSSNDGATELPASKSGGGGPQLPASKSGGGGPELPTPKTSNSGAPDLPTPKGSSGGPELPTPKSKSGGPELPKSASSSSGPELPAPTSNSGGPELPKSKDSAELPRSSEENLPRSGEDNLPRSGQDNLPRSGEDNLPRSGQDNLPRSGEDNLPRSGQDNLPQSGGPDQPPPPSEPPEDDDLFGAPIEDDEDDDLFDAPAGDEESEDLFGESSGLDDDSEDLFASPELDEDSEDLFAAPDDSGGLDDDSDDLFAAPVDDSPDESHDEAFSNDQFDAGDLEDDDLFESSEMDDDDLFADTPDQQQDDDDFLGGDQGFSFLEDESEPEGDDLEDWERDIEPDAGPSGPGDDFGDDLLDDSSPEPAAEQRERSTGDAGAPPSQPPSQPPSDGPDERFRPASSGLNKDPTQQRAPSATKSKEEAVDDDKKRGLMSLVGVTAVGLLLFGGVGFGVYHAFFAEEEVVEDEGPNFVELRIDDIRTDNYRSLRSVINDAGTGDLDATNQGRLLLAKSIFLTRYNDDTIAEQADALASELASQDSDPEVAVALAANEARRAEPEATRAMAEPLVENPQVAYFAHLVMGIADAHADFEDDDFSATIEVEEDDEIDAREEGDTGEFELDSELADLGSEGDIEEGDDDADGEAEASEDDGDDDEEIEEQRRLADRASEHFDAAAGADPERASPHYWKARLALHVEDIGAATDHLESAVDAAPNHVPSRLQAGQLYYEQGQLNDAEDHLREINETLSGEASDEERAESLHLMGMVHQARQESDKAIELFTRVLVDIDSSRTDTLEALAREYERTERYEEALNLFTTGEELGQEDPDVMLGIVRFHMGLEQWRSANDKLQEGEEMFPDDARFPHNLGLLNEEQGNPREARDAFERAVEIDSDLLTAYAALARLAWELDDDAAAGDEYVREIVARASLIDARIASEVAEFYHMSQRPGLARSWNEEALNRDPNFWEARLSLARVYLDEHETEEALELLERARDEGIQDLRLSAYLADAYRQNEQYDRAIEEINNALAEDPDDEEFFFIRGRVYFDRGNYATAREDFTNAYDLDPQFHDAYYYVGRTILAEDNYSRARRAFRHVLDYQPEDGKVHYHMGRTFDAEDSRTQALDSYSEAIESDPEFVEENPGVLIRRGELFADIGRTSSAAADLERALEIEPDSSGALLAIGSLHYQEGQYDLAIDHYTEVLGDDPEYPVAQYELGMSYVHEDQEEAGIRHLQRAVQYGYDDPEIYRTMGYVYRDLNRRADALESFRTFLQETSDGEVADSTRREMLRQIDELGG